MSLVYKARPRPLSSEELNRRLPFTSCVSNSLDPFQAPYLLLPHANTDKTLVAFCSSLTSAFGIKGLQYRHAKHTLYFTQGRALLCLYRIPTGPSHRLPPPGGPCGSAGPGPTHLRGGRQRAEAAEKPPRPAPPPPWPRRCRQGPAAALTDTALPTALGRAA